MKERCWNLFALVGLSLLLVGCGDNGAPTVPKRSSLYVEQGDYYGTYAGRRIDQEETATPDSVEDLIGSSTLTLHDGNSTYHMIHDGLLFGGNYVYIIGRNAAGDKINVLELYVYQVEGFSKAVLEGGNVDLAANKARGREPSTPEMLKRYEDIMVNISWRFALVDGGFRQIDSDKGPGMYEFTRDDDREPLGVKEGEGGEDINPGVGGA